MESAQGFDPANYFGGVEIEDLECYDKDSRLSDMFKKELEESLSKKRSNGIDLDHVRIEEYTKLL